MSKLNTEKIFAYGLEGKDDLNEFAKGILFLTNLRSQEENTIIDIKTFSDNSVEVFAYESEKLEELFGHYFKSIDVKEEVVMLKLGTEYTDYPAHVHKWIDEKEDNGVEYYIDCVRNHLR